MVSGESSLSGMVPGESSLSGASATGDPAFHKLPKANCLGPLPRIHARDLRAGALEPPRPVIIEGGMDSWKTKKWTSDYFRARFGDAEVQVVKLRSQLTRFLDFQRIPLRKFFDVMEDPTSSERYYLSLAAIWTESGKSALGGLADDFETPSFIRSKLVTGAFLWIAVDESKSNLHFDSRDNWLAMVSGRKRFVLFNDDQTPNLYPVSVRDPHVARSRIDFSNPDYANFPKLKDAFYFEDTVSEGEILYLPYHVWHYFWSAPWSVTVNFWSYPPEHVMRRILMQPHTHQYLLGHLVSNALRLKRKVPEFGDDAAT